MENLGGIMTKGTVDYKKLETAQYIPHCVLNMAALESWNQFPIFARNLKILEQAYAKPKRPILE